MGKGGIHLQGGLARVGLAEKDEPRAVRGHAPDHDRLLEEPGQTWERRQREGGRRWRAKVGEGCEWTAAHRVSLPRLVALSSCPECTRARLGASGLSSSSTSFGLNCATTLRILVMRAS